MPLFRTRRPATFDVVCLVAAGLGVCIGGGIVSRSWVGAYFVAFGIFHLAEFWVTAVYNSEKLNMASFLLTNGVPYAAAHLCSLVEMAVRRAWLKQPYPALRILLVGATLTIVGQYIRTKSMITAAQSFSHLLQRERRQDHILVTWGVYGYVRHPSYMAFLLFALGTQILVANWVSFVVYLVVLWSFFKKRIAVEEKSLVDFFGPDYESYRSRVRSGIPFVS